MTVTKQVAKIFRRVDGSVFPYASFVLSPDMLRREVPPTYRPLIPAMTFFIEPDISCSRFFAKALFTEESLAAYRASKDRSALRLTEMGDVLAKRLPQAIFLDIPCGKHALRDQTEDWDLIPLMHRLGIREYWEVDLTADVLHDRVQTVDVLKYSNYQLSKGIVHIGERTVDGLQVLTMQDDLLGFLAKMTDAHPPLCVYISALQPNAPDDISVPYLTALYDELHRLCGPRDTVILNSAAMLTEGIDDTAYPEIDASMALHRRGFTLLRRCPYGKVSVYVKKV